MPGACCTRGLVRKTVRKGAHEHTGTVGAFRHSLRNGFTAYAVLSSATNSSCHRRCRLDGPSIRLNRCRHRQLDTSNGCRNHTVLPYTASSVVYALCSLTEHKPALRPRHAPDAAASTASRPTFVTMANAPLLGRDGGVIDLIWGGVKQNSDYPKLDRRLGCRAS
jgi:hypothetical protein